MELEPGEVDSKAHTRLPIELICGQCLRLARHSAGSSCTSSSSNREAAAAGAAAAALRRRGLKVWANSTEL